MIKLIDFYSKNCVPCQMLKKELESFDNIEYIDTIEDFEKSLEFQVRKVPTVVILKDNKEVGRFVGFKTKQEITDYLNQI